MVDTMVVLLIPYDVVVAVGAESCGVQAVQVPRLHNGRRGGLVSSALHTGPSGRRADAAVHGPRVWSSNVRTDLHRRRMRRRRRQERSRDGDTRRRVQGHVSLREWLATVPHGAR